MFQQETRALADRRWFLGEGCRQEEQPGARWLASLSQGQKGLKAGKEQQQNREMSAGSKQEN